ncbi:hypothetical protein FRB97_008563 [Tulasnella sp. 331]|nr:hypothetical protein FRB97_008563 [Tulasnella sp. 331]
MPLTILGLGLLVTGVILLAPSLFAELVLLIGFGAEGVIAGSLAAWLQGSVTAAGSWFAVMQSWGATVILCIPRLIAGIAAIIAGIVASMGGSTKQEG